MHRDDFYLQMFSSADQQKGVLIVKIPKAHTGPGKYRKT